MSLREGSVVGGRYTLERALGRGATATVWLVRDGESGDHVAMKVLHEELAESAARSRFAREARRTADLDHERIVPLLDAGESDGTLYFTQPYMPGGTLRERLTRERQLSVEETLRIGRDLASALGHAHAKGFVHRDVKPENILFAEGEAYLSDFGISQAIEMVVDETTQSRLLVRGTVPYMSPEQASGLPDLDGRSDLFSLGAVLYECLAGVPAFIGATPDAVLAQVITAEPRDLRLYRSTVPDGVIRVIGRCMAKRAADRFRTAEELIEALERPERRVTPEPRPLPDPGPRPRVRMAMVAAVVLLGLMGAYAAAKALVGSGVAEVALDTTRIAVFPMELAVQDSAAGRLHDQLLRDGFQRTEGISLVPQLMVADRLAQGDGAEGAADLQAIARELRAGRYVRGRISSAGGRSLVALTLLDSRSGDPLYDQEFTLPESPAAAAREWERRAAMLLLRSARLPERVGDSAVAWSIPALQALTRGHDALKEWDLALADSMYSVAQEIEPDDPITQFWLAQVRAWARRPRDGWAGHAERASAAGAALPPRERELALGLVALGQRRYPDACAIYDRIIRADSTDYAGWFGLGQCNSLDGLVVPDSAMPPHGWRFRASHQRAVVAYQQAFRLLPSMHKGIHLEGFDTRGPFVLRSTDIRVGRSADGRQTFAGRLDLRGDTLVMVPVPFELLAKGGDAATPPGFTSAIARQRADFRETAQRWSAAFPRGSEAKEAVALALEVNGMPAAIDTIRAAQRFARSDAARIALAIIEVRLLLRFGLPDDLAALRRAGRLADSLIDVEVPRAGAGRPGPEAHVVRDGSEALESLAILRARCDDALHFARRRESVSGLDLPDGPTSESREVLDRVVMRCDPVSESRRVQGLLASLEEDPAMRDPAQRPFLLRSLVFRPLLMMTQRDSVVLARMVRDLDDPLLLAARALSVRDLDGARRALAAFDALRDPAMPMSPDIAYIAARLWADAGDIARARAILDDQLRRVRLADAFHLREPGNVGGLVRAMTWRAQMAASDGDGRTAQRWRGAITALQAH